MYNPAGSTTNVEYSTYSKFYQLNRHKSEQAEFENVKLYKEICDTKEAIWSMKWSSCGQLLAAAGGDHLVRIYCCPKAWKYFSQLRIKASGQHISPTPSKERDNEQSTSNIEDPISEDPLLLFSIYQGHTADILDVAWSRNHFLLSSSMDKTVRLWHITRVECLCTFFHADFVSTAQFHPHDDRYFVSGSLDGKLRLWSIPDKKVTMWNEVMSLPLKDNEQPTHGLITASAFVQNGKFAVIGTYDGRIIFYSTEQLKFFTQLHVGKHHEKIKITGIESVDDTKILVTTNDSRIRLYDLRDLSLVCKYKGCTNISSQIRATVSPDNKYIICGSENSSFYIWPMYETSSQRKDRNYAWECIRLTTGTDVNIISAASFAPIPQLIVPQSKYVIVVADLHGTIRILNK
jgi:WD40 repeat protein